MAKSFLESHDHTCFHSPRAHIHAHPNLHHCQKQMCPGAISEEMARKTGNIDEDGNVLCPDCGCETFPSGERKVVEVHAELCTDETIHYPEWRKTGEITEEQFHAWKATLTDDELCGIYKRVPDVHVTVQMHHDEAALLETDLDAFNALLQARLKERAEIALKYQAPYRHTTTRADIKL